MAGKENTLQEFGKYVSQSVLSQLGVSCYILADTYFISKGVGADGLTALNLAIPVFSVMNGCGFMLGIGSGTKYGIMKGTGNEKRGDVLFTSSLCVVTVLAVGVSLAAVNAFWGGSDSALSQLGSSGSEVRAIQERLKERGLFNDSVTGYYGEKTKAAVIKFQKQQGISQTGTAGPQTLRALGISIGSVPSATEQNINLLARIISAEARGEPYVGQVAVGAVILNRIEHPSFPDTLSGVIYQNGAFTAVVDGQFNEPVAASAYNAARDALNGWDPTNGCVYYYNPAKTSNAYMHAKPTVTVIGSHRFCM